MAEAHSAVAFSFSITHEGWDVNFDREVLHLVWQSGVRSWKKRFFRFHVSRTSESHNIPCMILISTIDKRILFPEQPEKRRLSGFLGEFMDHCDYSNSDTLRRLQGPI